MEHNIEHSFYVKALTKKKNKTKQNTLQNNIREILIQKKKKERCIGISDQQIVLCCFQFMKLLSQINLKL